MGLTVDAFGLVPAGGSADVALPVPIGSVIVDNHTGSYLYIAALGMFVPPLTIGWTQPVGGVNAVHIASAVGPEGQAISTAGNPAIVTITTDILPASAGQPQVVSTYPPVVSSSINSFVLNASGNLNATLVTAVPGQRVVIFGVDVVYTAKPAGTVRRGAFYEWQLLDLIPNVWATGVLSEHRPAERLDFGAAPLVLPAGQPLNAEVTIPLGAVTIAGTIGILVRYLYA